MDSYLYDHSPPILIKPGEENRAGNQSGLDDQGIAFPPRDLAIVARVSNK
jgi:hypothetical protein